MYTETYGTLSFGHLGCPNHTEFLNYMVILELTVRERQQCVVVSATTRRFLVGMQAINSVTK